MDMAILALTGILGIISLVCLIMVWVKMFQHGQTALGILCIVLSFCGIGVLITFILGWVNARRWNIQPVMITWTVCFLINVVLAILFPNVLVVIYQQPQISP